MKNAIWNGIWLVNSLIWTIGTLRVLAQIDSVWDDNKLGERDIRIEESRLQRRTKKGKPPASFGSEKSSGGLPKSTVAEIPSVPNTGRGGEASASTSSRRGSSPSSLSDPRIEISAVAQSSRRSRSREPGLFSQPVPGASASRGREPGLFSQPVPGASTSRPVLPPPSRQAPLVIIDERGTQHQLHNWWDVVKQSANSAKFEATKQSPEVAQSRATRRTGRREKEIAEQAKIAAKAARHQAGSDRSIATLAAKTNFATSAPSMEKAGESAIAAFKATQQHAKAEKTVADKLSNKEVWSGVSERVQTSARAFSRSRLRAAEWKAFNDDYVSQIDKHQLSKVSPGSPNYRKAKQTADQSALDAKGNVNVYRERFEEYQTVRNELSGSSSSESEKSYSAYPKNT